MISESKFYIWALVLGVLSLVPIFAHISPLSAYAFLPQLGSLLCLAGGFVVWARPIIERGVAVLSGGYWRRMVLRILMWLANGVVAILVLIPSRSLVAKATGLPPTDFDLSVAWWALWFFPIAWSLILSFVVFILATFLFLRHFFCYVRSYFPGPPRHMNRDLAVERGFGAIAFVVIVLAGISEYEQGVNSLVKPVLWFAYIAEYHETNRFPKLEPDVRSHLHENGVISYAEIVNGEVRIRVESSQ